MATRSKKKTAALIKSRAMHKGQKIEKKNCLNNNIMYIHINY